MPSQNKQVVSEFKNASHFLNCQKCKSKNVVIKTPGIFCAKCFIKNLESRIIKNLRSNWPKKGSIYLLKTDTNEYATASHILKKIFDKNKDIQIKKITSIDKDKQVLIPDNLEQYLSTHLEKILEKAVKPKDKNLYLLRNVSSKEAELYAKLKKLSFSKQANKTKLIKAIDKIEEKNPGSVFSFLKGINALD